MGSRRTYVRVALSMSGILRSNTRAPHKRTSAHVHARAHIHTRRGARARAHTHTHTHTQTHTHTHTNTHTHTHYGFCSIFHTTHAFSRPLSHIPQNTKDFVRVGCGRDPRSGGLACCLQHEIPLLSKLTAADKKKYSDNGWV
jgi:hypothetical protein